MTSDVELLEIEIETLWDKDARGRLVRKGERDSDETVHMVLGVAAEGGCVAAFGSEVPDDVVPELERIVRDVPAEQAPAYRPPALDRCAQLLRSHVGDVQESSGPSYVVPLGTRFKPDVAIHLSTRDSRHLRGRIPDGSGWRSEEWTDLLDGRLGPWAMAVARERVLSICHSARLSDRGAEAGTWTHPDVRGRGYAAATTAAWASLLRDSGRTLFYSTDGGNVSSQRVAQRLELPLIGWLWKLERPGD